MTYPRPRSFPFLACALHANGKSPSFSSSTAHTTDFLTYLAASFSSAGIRLPIVSHPTADPDGTSTKSSLRSTESRPSLQ